MDDVYAINVARTSIRDGYNTGDADLIISVLDPGLVDFSDQEQNKFGANGIEALRRCVQKMHDEYSVKYTVIIIEIRVIGDIGLEYGWQIFELQPKSGGPPVNKRERYMDVWQRRPEGWKLLTHCSNADVADTLVAEV